MRAVADTNVYISALNFGGTADEVLTLGRAQAIQLFISPSILQEVEGVLLSKFRWSAARTRQAIAGIREFAQRIHSLLLRLDASLNPKATGTPPCTRSPLGRTHI